ncbi:universal stress protein [Herbaspirillum sp. HC18]|nr:universal stress protein [Herbaspirillum sp. HC18]
MERIRKILVATDYSEEARRAETRAVMLCMELKAETLELITVRNTRMGLRTAATFSTAAEIRQGEIIGLLERQQTLPALREVAGPACVCSIRSGSTPEAIIARAAEIRAGLIVAAAKGKSFFADLFRRHNNDALIRLADRPVLLVSTEPKDAYKRVLVGIDFSDESREAARAALAIAPSAHFTFLHAFRVPDEEMMLETGISMDIIHQRRMRAREAARVEMNAFIDRLGPRKQLISRSLQHGIPAAALSEQAKQLNTDLIAVGKHGKSRLVDFLLGSVTQRLVEQGMCDLLVTTSGESGEEYDDRPAA